MTRNKFWLISFGFIGLVLLSVPMLFAQMTYHIGSGRTADGVQYFNTLEDLRIATAEEVTGIYGTFMNHLFGNDTVILYGDDNSLTAELGIADNANVTIRSDDPATRRIIEMVAGTAEPIFNMNRSSDIGSTLNVQSIEMVNGYSPEGGGAVYAWWHNNLYLNNTIFSNNRGAALGGAIYYWDALDSEIVDSDFINNSTTGAGGAILINASTTLSQSDTTNVTLRVTENATVKLDAATGTYRPTSTFSGNRAGVTWDGQGSVVAGSGYANSIDFTGAEGNTVNFFIDTAEGTLLDMQDPFRTNAPTSGYYDLGYTVNLDKTGLGTWRLGGTSTIDGSSGTTVQILEGVLEFSRDAEINAIGANDSFTVSAGAEGLFNGNNRITGTTVTFSEGATMSFNLDNYQVGQTDAMLFLQGDDLTVSGTRINVNGLAAGQYGNFVLVEGANTLDIGDFNLWIGDANIDVSGRVSERYGYSLGYLEDLAGNVLNDKQLVLTVNPTDNTVLRWNDNGVNEWNVTSKNWTLIRDNSMDSFVPGDTVQFFGSGTHRVNLTEDVLIKHNSVRDAEGKTWYAAANDTTGMHVSGDGNWTFTGKSIVDSTTFGRASLLFDGSGTLTLAGEKANDYSYTILAGTGTLLTANANQLGTQAVYFRDSEYKTPEEVSKLHFTAGTTLETQLVAEKDGHGLVTASNAYGNNLTLSRVANENETRGGSVLVKDGGKLELSASPQGNFGRMIFSGNGTRRDAMTGSALLTEGGAVYVENGGELTLNQTDTARRRVPWPCPVRRPASHRHGCR